MLIVENGTGVINADSYVTIEEMDSHARDFGNAAWTSSTDTAQKEIAARKGSAFIDMRYASLITGEPVNPEQGMMFPRLNFLPFKPLQDDRHLFILKWAAIEAAMLSFSGVDLMPDTTGAPNVIRKALANGALETEWDKDSFGTSPIFRKIEAILYPLFGSMPDPSIKNKIDAIPIARV